jgi:anthranilate/para-aminobenzoate synthase component II
MKIYIYVLALILCVIGSATAQTVHWTKFQTFREFSFDIYTIPHTSLVYLNGSYTPIALMDAKTGKIMNQFKNIYKPDNDEWQSGNVVAVNSKNTFMISQQLDTLIMWSVKGSDSIIQRKIITGVAISSDDGEKIFYISPKNDNQDEIVVLKSDNLQEIMRFPVSKDRQKIIPNKNGSLIAYITKADERKLVIISTETGKVVNTITVDYELYFLRFSIDNESIIAYHNSKLVKHKIIGTGTTEEIFPYKNYGDLSPDEKYIAYNANAGIVLYNLQTKSNEIIPMGYSENYDIFPPIRFTGDGTSVLIGDFNIIVVDVLNKKLSCTLTIPEVFNVHVFNKNKNLHINCLWSLPGYVLDTKKGNYITRGSGVGSRISPISVIPIAKSSNNEKNKLFYRNVETGYYFSKELDYEPHEQRTAVSDNGKLIAAASSDSQTVIIYNTENLEEIFRIKLDLKEQDDMKLEMVRYIQFFNNDNSLGIITDDNYFVLSMNEKKIINKIISDNGVPFTYSLRQYITDDGKYVLTFDRDNINLLDTEFGNTSLVWNHKEHPESYTIEMLKWIDNTTFGLFMDTRFSNNDTLFIIRYDGKIVERYPIATNNQYLSTASAFDCIFEKDSLTMFLSLPPRRFTSWTQRRVVTSVVNLDVFDYHSLYTYPQPSNDEVTVELSHDSKAYSMSVHTITGEQVLHEVFEPTSIFTFSTRNITNGMFIMRVTLNNGESLTKPLQVIH